MILGATSRISPDDIYYPMIPYFFIRNIDSCFEYLLFLDKIVVKIFGNGSSDERFDHPRRYVQFRDCFN